jgi:hypothetical protein
MKKGAMAVALGGLIALAAMVNATTTKKWTCTLTGKTVEKCCCVQQKDGKLYCTLAKKTVDPCCCEPAGK